MSIIKSENVESAGRLAYLLQSLQGLETHASSQDQISTLKESADIIAKAIKAELTEGGAQE